MTSNLSEYVRTLGPGGEPPAPADYEAARELLRADLVRAMVRRGLWSAPPRYLGVEGAGRWTRELLDELVSDCYVELFLRRLPALKNQLLTRDDVGGVIARGVRNFLHDLQRDNDPLGYKVYEILRDSLRRLHEAGKLRILGQDGGKARIHNRTVCAFVPSGESGQEVDLEERVRAWTAELWPDLITAQGRARSRVRDRLDAHLAQLGELGVETFRFQDLVEPMKDDVRRRWSEEMAALAEEMTSTNDSAGGPRFRELRDCVLGKLEQEPPGEQEDLLKLWLFLWTYAAGLNPSEVAAKAERGGRAPADLGLAEELGIARHRLPTLKKTLGRLIRACESAISRKAAVKGSEGPDAMDSTSRYEQLRIATGESAARWAARRAEIEGDPRPPRPGDTFVLAHGSELLVEWVVVEEDASTSSLLLVAVDDGPEAGSHDVAIDSRRTGGLASVRCALELRLDAGSPDLRRRTGELPPEALAEVRRKRAALADGSLAGTLREREVDEDPEYQRRLEELAEVRAALEASTTRPGKVLAFRPRGRGPSARRRFPFAVAASILMTLGLGSTVVYQQRRLTSLEERLREAPELNLPVIWLTAGEPVRGEDDPLVVSSEARRLALVLEVVSPKVYPRYRVELTRGESGQEVWTSDELLRSGSELAFDLPRSLFETGGYELRIHGLYEEPPEESGPGTEAELLEEFSLWIRLE